MIYNDKEYNFKEENWYGVNKNGKDYKITQVKLIDELNTVFLDDKDRREGNINGLGDLISRVTSILGFEECEGCARRKRILNEFPFLKKDLRQLTEEEEELMDRVIAESLVVTKDVDDLFKLYNSMFGTKLERCNCPGLVRTMIKRLIVVRNNK